MSRLIIKNLPKKIKEERVKSIFSAHGNVTDCSLKFTKDGVFRRFAFIGFQKQEEAENARKYFDKTFIDTSPIQVEFAKSFGDTEKPRAWSKYSQESSAFQSKQKTEVDNTQPIVQESKAEKRERNKEERLKDMLGDLKDDPGFEEFLSVHQNVRTKTAWSNDTLPTQQDQGKRTVVSQSASDDDSGNSSDESNKKIQTPPLEHKEIKKKRLVAVEPDKEANKKGLSDLEYLKSKMDTKDLDDESSSSSNSSDESSASSDSSDEEESSTVKGDHSIKQSNSSESSSDSESGEEKISSRKGNKSVKPVKAKVNKTPEKQIKADSEQVETESSEEFVLKMRGFQGNVIEKSIIEFFKPLKTKSVLIPKNAKRKPIGIAYVEFLKEKDLDQALRKNKNFIGGKRVFLKKAGTEKVEETVLKARPWELKKTEAGEEDEGIGESGRLFVRNLAYICTEEHLEELFSKYGPLTEVSLPVDKITKKIKGFAHITFMIPEHAVKAFTELDGSVFLGRMMHVLPGKARKEEEFQVTEHSSFKKQKAAKEKATAGSAHNWNSLFLGVNAVADVMADKYGASKSQILDTEGSQSLGVRMALGETQVVSETRDFLTENGVQLDSFSQPSAPRSKSVILVKNLPMATNPEDLKSVFSKYGDVGRIVLPPSGISAIIEFLVPTEARAAFMKLAYTKFKHTPLYLEWAPMEVFKPKDTPEATENTSNTQESSKKESEEADMSDDDTTEAGTVLFVKNLNFDTREDGLQKLFEKCGQLKSVTVAKKKDMKNPGQFLSMGYGFVEYQTKASADTALKELQYTELDGHQLDLKVSNRTTLKPQSSGKKRQAEIKQKSSKILVRNIPFEAKQNEVLELFKVFGELKFVRLPKKLGGTGRHRGFGFVDFLTKQDAKRAFNALCHSTHLYGRRLVLEWAEAEENIDELRKKTAEHFHDEPARKRLRKSDLMDALGE